jgi:MerR family transcriptional regulator/heat shock protein HspR
MTVSQYQIVLYSADNQRLTLDDLASHAGMHPALVERLVEFGLVTPLKQEGPTLFDPSAVSRLRTTARLRQNLGINLAGISVILDLVDKICALQRENQYLRSRYQEDDHVGKG